MRQPIVCETQSSMAVHSNNLQCHLLNVIKVKGCISGHKNKYIMV